MEKQALITNLINFLTTENACKQTLACLDQKAEIGIRIADSVDLTVHYRENQVQVSEMTSYSADFIFSASPAAIEVLISEKNLPPAQLGIKLFKQMISRDIHVSMPGNVFQVSTKGYLKILTLGGVEFLSELKKHNLTSIPKILAALKKLRQS